MNMPTSKNFDKLFELIKKGSEVGFKQKLRSLSPSQRLDVLKEQNDQQATLLEYAAARDLTEIVRVVIRSVPAGELYDILAMQDIYDDTPLHVAAYFGHTDIVKLVARLLLTAGLYRLMKIQDKDGDTPLACGFIKKKTSTAKVILNCLPAADMSKVISIPNNHGNTVLSWSAQGGHVDLLELCVDIIPPEELYSHVLVADNDGDTVIHCAAGGNQSEAAVYLLDKLNAIQVGETCVIKNKKGHTPIEYAKSKGYHEFVTVVGAYLRDRKIFLNDEKVDADSHQNTSSADSGVLRDGETSLVDNKKEDADSHQKTSSADSGIPHDVETSVVEDRKEHADSHNNTSSADSGMPRDVETSVVEMLHSLKVGEKLGSGGQATVYRGTWLSTPVAIKILPNPFGIDLSKTPLHGVEEYNAIKNLRHPNIIQFFGVGQLKTDIGLVMELCDTDLKIMSQQIGKSGEALGKLLRIIKDSLCGLVYLHDKNMIHMDIKPHNILVQSGRGKLADFGLSDLVENFQDMSITYSPWQGTSMYRAPELLHRYAPTKAADVWSMGVTALEVFTGKLPYPFENFVRHKRAKVPKDLLDKKLPQSLQMLSSQNQKIMQLVMTFEPDQRLAAADWLESLENYQT